MARGIHRLVFPVPEQMLCYPVVTGPSLCIQTMPVPIAELYYPASQRTIDTDCDIPPLELTNHGMYQLIFVEEVNKHLVRIDSLPIAIQDGSHNGELLGVSAIGQFWVREIGVKKLLV